MRRLLMGLSRSCYADFMGPRCGLYGNADMSAVFWGSPPSENRNGQLKPLKLPRELATSVATWETKFQNEFPKDYVSSWHAEL